MDHHLPEGGVLSCSACHLWSRIDKETGDEVWWEKEKQEEETQRSTIEEILKRERER